MQSIKGKNHADVAIALMNIGIVLRKEKNMTEARNYFSQALPIIETNFGVYSKEFATALMLLGKSEMDCKSFQSAIDIMSRALKIRQFLLGDHAETADSLDQLGIAFSQIKKNLKSLSHFQQVHEMKKKIYSIDHPETGVAA